MTEIRNAKNFTLKFSDAQGNWVGIDEIELIITPEEGECGGASIIPEDAAYIIVTPKELPEGVYEVDEDFLVIHRHGKIYGIQFDDVGGDEPTLLSLSFNGGKLAPS